MNFFKSLPRSYQVAFIMATLLHVSLLIAMAYEKKNERPVLKKEALTMTKPKQVEIVQAKSIDSKEVEKTVQRLKNEREAERRKEAQRKQALANAEKQARDKRIAEEKRLQKLQQEKKQLEAKRRAERLAEEKRLQALKAEKAAEAKKLEALRNEQLALKKKQEEEKARKLAEEKAEQERLAAQERARVAGVVDKYKALILSAIGQQWILPDAVNSNLSSQFKIKLAPSGQVLDVQLLRSSGDPVLDRSAEAAIYKASPLPVPSDAKTFNIFREISLTVRPENVRG